MKAEPTIKVADLTRLRNEYEQMARDAQAQATRLGALHDVAVAHINALWEWIEAGTAPPAPSIPTALVPYLSLPRLERASES